MVSRAVQFRFTLILTLMNFIHIKKKMIRPKMKAKQKSLEEELEYLLVMQMTMLVMSIRVQIACQVVSVLSNSWHLSVNASVSRDIRTRGMLEGVTATCMN